MLKSVLDNGLFCHGTILIHSYAVQSDSSILVSDPQNELNDILGKIE